MISPFPEEITRLSSKTGGARSIQTVNPCRQMRLRRSRFSHRSKPLLTLCVFPPNLSVREWVNWGRGTHGADGPNCNKVGITGG